MTCSWVLAACWSTRTHRVNDIYTIEPDIIEHYSSVFYTTPNERRDKLRVLRGPICRATWGHDYIIASKSNRYDGQWYTIRMLRSATFAPEDEVEGPFTWEKARLVSLELDINDIIIVDNHASCE